MRNRGKWISLVMGVFIFLFTSIALAEDFSADMINTSRGGIFQGKIFVTKDKMRMETPQSISITRMDRRVVWILMPKDKMYMEQPFDPSKAVATSEKVMGEIERKFIGKEIIDGRMTDKYQIVYNQNGNRATIFQWLAAGLKIPVKTAAADNSWIMEYKNIKIGSQPAALFEVPPDYQKFSYQMPSSMQDMLKGYAR